MPYGLKIPGLGKALGATLIVSLLTTNCNAQAVIVRNQAGPNVSAASSQPAQVILGTVVNSDGTTISGAQIQLHRFSLNRYTSDDSNPSNILTTVYSDSNASFTVAVPQEFRSASLIVSANGYVTEIDRPFGNRNIVSSRSNENGTSISRNIVLYRTGTFRGIVADENGQPLSGVNVSAYPAMLSKNQYEADQPISEAVTDGDGEFELLNLPHKDAHLRFHTGGYARSVLTTPPDVPIAVNLRKGATVRGNAYLFDTQAPAVGTTFTLIKDTNNIVSDKPEMRPTEINWSSTGYTGKSGSFSIRHVPPGNYKLHLTSRSHAPRELSIWNPSGSDSLQVTVPEDQEQISLNVPVFRGYSIEGKVTESGTSNTVANATVWLTNSYPHRSTQADDQGYYRFDTVFPQGHNALSITATAKGFALISTNRWESPDTTVTLHRELNTSASVSTIDIPMMKLQKLRGIIIDADTSTPLSNAQVQLVYSNYFNSHPGANSQVEKAISNHEGRFEITTRPGQPFRVRTEMVDYPVNISEVFRIVEEREVILRLNHGAMVMGKVTDPEGNPVEGAHINASFSISGSRDNSGNDSSYSENFGNNTRSEADGSFQFDRVPTQGRMNFAASKEGFAPSEPFSIALKPGDKNSTVTLKLRVAKHLAGRVLDSTSKPLPNVQMFFQSEGTNGGGNSRTGEDGTYRINSLPDAPVSVSINHPTYGNEWFYGVEVGRDGVDFQYGKGDKDGRQRQSMQYRKDREKKGITLRGIVVNYQSGEPVKNFKIYTNNSSLTVQTDPDLEGAFTMKGLQPENPYQLLRISAPGYAMLDSGPLYFPPNQPEVEQTFKMGPGGTLTGRAIDKETKKPVSGVVVALVNVTLGGAAIRGGEDAVEKVAPATTDAEGKFTMTGVGQGRKMLTFTPPPETGFIQMTQPVDAVYNQVTDMGDIEFGAGGTIKGKLVRFPGNEPVPNARITCTNTKETVSDVEGKFEFTKLVNGLYRVEAPDFGANSWIGVEQLETKELTLEIGTGQLVGTVVRAGQPYPCEVKAQKIGFGQSVARWSQADNSGRFTVTELPPGRWEIILTSKSDAAYQVSDFVDMPESGESVEHTFTFPSGGVQVTVLDAAGKAVPRIQVQARKEAGSSAPLQGQALQSQTNESGQATFDGLAPGSYTVVATGENGERGEARGIQVGNDQKGQATITLSAGAGGTLVSTALNMQTGKPVPSAWCYLFGDDGKMFDHNRKRDENGVMTIDNIPAGTYRVQVSALGFSVSEQTVTIQAGQSQAIDDVLYPSGALRWALKTRAGVPVKDVPCKLTPSDASAIEEPRSGTTNADGVFVVRGLMPGAYVATATYNGKQVSKPVMIYAANVTDEVSWVE